MPDCTYLGTRLLASLPGYLLAHLSTYLYRIRVNGKSITSLGILQIQEILLGMDGQISAKPNMRYYGAPGQWNLLELGAMFNARDI